MEDDFDPETPDSAAAAARRRQLLVTVASAVSVLALMAVTGFGLHARHHDTVSSSAAGDLNASTSTSSNAVPVASTSDDPVAISPAATADALEPTPSPLLLSSPPARPPAERSPSPTVRPTPKSSHPGVAVLVLTDETVSIKMSPTRVSLGQQIKVTITVVDAGLVTASPAVVSIGSRIPSDTFDGGPKGCVFELGGANCPTVALRPGQQTSLVFTITPGWMPGGSDFDLIFGELNAVDSHGQQYQLGDFQEQVWVDDGTASQAPPSASPAPSSAPPVPVSAPPSSPLG